MVLTGIPRSRARSSRSVWVVALRQREGIWRHFGIPQDTRETSVIQTMPPIERPFLSFSQHSSTRAPIGISNDQKGNVFVHGALQNLVRFLSRMRDRWGGEAIMAASPAPRVTDSQTPAHTPRPARPITPTQRLRSHTRRPKTMRTHHFHHLPVRHDHGPLIKGLLFVWESRARTLSTNSSIDMKPSNK